MGLPCVMDMSPSDHNNNNSSSTTTNSDSMRCSNDDDETPKHNLESSSSGNDSPSSSSSSGNRRMEHHQDGVEILVSTTKPKTNTTSPSSSPPTSPSESSSLVGSIPEAKQQQEKPNDSYVPPLLQEDGGEKKPESNDDGGGGVEVQTKDIAPLLQETSKSTNTNSNHSSPKEKPTRRASGSPKEKEKKKSSGAAERLRKKRSSWSPKSMVHNAASETTASLQKQKAPNPPTPPSSSGASSKNSAVALALARRSLVLSAAKALKEEGQYNPPRLQGNKKSSKQQQNNNPAATPASSFSDAGASSTTTTASSSDHFSSSSPSVPLEVRSSMSSPGKTTLRERLQRRLLPRQQQNLQPQAQDFVPVQEQQRQDDEEFVNGNSNGDYHGEDGGEARNNNLDILDSYVSDHESNVSNSMFGDVDDDVNVGRLGRALEKKNPEKPTLDAIEASRRGSSPGVRSSSGSTGLVASAQMVQKQNNDNDEGDTEDELVKEFRRSSSPTESITSGSGRSAASPQQQQQQQQRKIKQRRPGGGAFHAHRPRPRTPDVGLLRLSRSVRYGRRGKCPSPIGAHEFNDVKVHIYDLIASETIMIMPGGVEFPIGKCFNAINNGLHMMGTGAYHAAIEINGIEYAYGANNAAGMTGVFTCPPKESPGYEYRTTIDFGKRKTSKRTWISVPKPNVVATAATAAREEEDAENDDEEDCSSNGRDSCASPATVIGVSSQDDDKSSGSASTTRINPDARPRRYKKPVRQRRAFEELYESEYVYREIETFVEGHSLMQDMAREYMGRDYDLLRRNCCHFVRDASLRLGVNREEIPTWFMNFCEAGAATESACKRLDENLFLPLRSCVLSTSSSQAAASQTRRLTYDKQRRQEETQHFGFEVISVATPPPPKGCPTSNHNNNNNIMNASTKPQQHQPQNCNKGRKHHQNLEIVKIVESIAGKAHWYSHAHSPRTTTTSPTNQENHHDTNYDGDDDDDDSGEPHGLRQTMSWTY